MSRTKTAVGLAVLAVVLVAAALALSGGSERRSVLGPSQMPATIWAVGDGADGGADASAVAAIIAASDPDRFLYLGDVYENGTAAEFEGNYRTVYGELEPITTPTIGNHEIERRSRGYDPYWAAEGDQDPTAPRKLELGGWELLRLEYSGERGYPVTDEQLDWLRRALQKPGTCRLAFWHAPRYSAGDHHGDDRLAEPLWELLAGHAALVVNGHEHNYQRFRPNRGIVQVIAGTGGHEHYLVDAADPRLAAADDEHYGALRIDLARGLARLTFVGADGETLDQAEVGCEPVSP
jgi:hypothetical protein